MAAFITQWCPLVLPILVLTKGSWGLDCSPIIAPEVVGRLLPSGELQALGYTFPTNQFERINQTHFRVCICSVRTCIRKCCAVGESYIFGMKKCQPSSVPFHISFFDHHNHLIEPSPLNHLQIVTGDICPKGKYRLLPATNPLDVNYLRRNGVLWMPGAEKNYTYKDYCVDNMNKPDAFGEEMVLLCFQEQPSEDHLYPIGMIISIPFLLVTFCVYAFLPELQNLHGKSLMCHVASLTTGYVFLVVVQLMGKEVDRQFCVAAGYLTQFGFLASFFWLNVMSFDIWWTFSGFGGFRRGKDRQKFLFYSAYAWGGVAILMAVSIALDLSPNVPDYIIKPEIGVIKCWFKSQAATLAYFYGPMAIILVCNLGLFTATAYKIFMSRKESNRVLQGDDSRRNNEANKQRFFLYLKLFLVMGVNWVMEVVSWLVGGPKEIWYITDVCNTLQGLFIFVIFVWKTRTKKLLVSRFSKTVSRDSEATITTATSMKSSRNSSSLNMTNVERKVSASAKENGPEKI